ncbi:hypothetical protein PG985_003315 [Apiospora marii]|uniref:uncharacterized protein n=1 Tax=Apiospora marii TaxID=335849 RepID=UPI00312D68DF
MKIIAAFFSANPPLRCANMSSTTILDHQMCVTRYPGKAIGGSSAVGKGPPSQQTKPPHVRAQQRAAGAGSLASGLGAWPSVGALVPEICDPETQTPTLGRNTGFLYRPNTMGFI